MKSTVADPTYRCVREVFDAAEATWLISHGWKLIETVNTRRWASGFYSENTSYVLGLPKNALRDVRAVSMAAA